LLSRNVVEFAWSPVEAEIGFSTVDDSDSAVQHLLVAGPDGERATELAAGRYLTFQWSPRGSELAAYRVTADDSRGELLVGAEDGSSLVKIADTGGPRLSFDWSPDGGRLAYNHYGVGPMTIQIVNRDGTGHLVLGAGFAPLWSPRGDRIAVGIPEGVFDGARAITIRPDGSDVRRLGQGCYSGSGRWSPDGSHIALPGQCGAVIPESDPSVEVADPEGLSTGIVGEGRPIWSPTGRRLALARVWTRPFLSLVDPDGGNRVSFDAVGGRGDLSWSPSGKYLVFTRVNPSSPLGASSLQLAREDGKLLRRLAIGSMPAWSPAGRWIAFVRLGGRHCDRLFVADLRHRTVAPLTMCASVKPTVGAATGTATPPGVAVSIRVSTYDPVLRERPTSSFSLTCAPVSGTLPFAQRICGDIGRHPRAMLDPGKPRTNCGGSLVAPLLRVTARFGQKQTVLSGMPFCNWPGGTALGIYWAATKQDAQTLDRFEPRLRCGEDPVLLARPTPWASVNACRHGLWTAR
jgi:Tol biopolymer transport system component